MTVLNYSCFNNSPIVGMTCESNMLTFSIESELQNELQIYPNPSSHGFKIYSLSEQTNILVYDLSGALVAQFQNQTDSTFGYE